MLTTNSPLCYFQIHGRRGDRQVDGNGDAHLNRITCRDGSTEEIALASQHAASARSSSQTSGNPPLQVAVLLPLRSVQKRRMSFI